MSRVVRDSGQGAPETPEITHLTSDEGTRIDRQPTTRDVELARPLSEDPTFQRAVHKAIKKCGDPTIDDGSTIQRGLE